MELELMRLIKNLSLTLTIIISGFVDQVLAVDFGKVGASFEIKEKGFVSMMMEKLKTIDWEKEAKKMQEFAQTRVANPLPVSHIRPATETREFWYDPSFILLKDAILPCGKVLYKAGTRVNPLNHIDLERRLFFIDGRIDAQIEWLKERLNEKKEERIENQIILVAGSVFHLQKELAKEVYFDQSGEITTKLGIGASPAIAEQDRKMIRIRELRLKE